MRRLKDDIVLLAVILAAPCAALCAWALRPAGWAAVPAVAGLYLAWVLGLVVGWVLFVFLLSLTVDLKKPVTEDKPLSRWIVITIIGLLVRAGRLRITVKGWEDLPRGRFLLVGNHCSNYDPIATVWALRRRGVELAFITKPENMKLPLVRYIHRANFLVIDRDDARKAIVTIHAAADLLERDVVNVGVYPEGTRSKTGQLLPFHDAVFKIAKRAGVPIVTAAVSGTERIKANAPWRPTDVTIDLLEPIGAEEVAASTTKQLGGRVRAMLEEAAGSGRHPGGEEAG